MHDAALVLAWLVLAHLAADFVFQTTTIAAAKAAHGRRALGGLLAHGGIVGLCLIPVGLAFGDRGWAFVGASVVTHLAIDRAKVLLTRRAAAAALREAHERHEGPQPPEHLGRAWTPMPAALFLADQVAHLAVAAMGWAILLADRAPTAAWASAVDGSLGSWDRSTVHAVVATTLVITILGILNIRAASLFVGILVRPVEVSAGGDHRWGGRAAPAVDAPPVRKAPQDNLGTRRRWSIRVGPIDAHVTAEDQAVERGAVGGSSGEARDADVQHRTAPLAASARVGSTIGILERILIVVFVLTGSDVAIGFVVAAKTLARFKLLDDRDFAEYYLLGTLASVAVAILSALAGRAALTALLG
jgi:hypothetical protein